MTTLEKMKTKINYISDVYMLYWKNAFKFTGRSRRSEYWWPHLINFILTLLIGIPLIRMLDLNGMTTKEFDYITSLVAVVFSVIFIIPDTAVLIRRLHDVSMKHKTILIYVAMNILWIMSDNVANLINGKSLIDNFQNMPSFISIPVGIILIGYFIFSIYIFFKTIEDSAKETNEYGPNPKKDTL